MDDTTQTTVNPADVSPLVDLVEVLDEAGNPTGQYRPRTSEDAPAEATIFTTAEDGEHVVN